MEVLDQGHRYRLISLDGKHDQELRFVKRFDPDRPWRFPGNGEAYAGTTMQSVIRALLERARYLQSQVWCVENIFIVGFLRACLWLLEFRAARRIGMIYWKSQTFAEKAPMCPTCGHTICNRGCGGHIRAK